MSHRIEPDLITAKALYPKVLEILQNFEKFVDNHKNLNAEIFDTAYQDMQKTLHELTGKDMSRFMLWEWWEADGIEALAFEIALPDPQPIRDMNKDELTEIIRRIKNIHDFDNNGQDNCSQDNGDNDWRYLLTFYGESYYNKLLQLSFPTSYDYEYFCSHVIDDNYVEFDIDDIAECIYSNQPFQSQYKKLFAKYGEKFDE